MRFGGAIPAAEIDDLAGAAHFPAAHPVPECDHHLRLHSDVETEPAVAEIARVTIRFSASGMELDARRQWQLEVIFSLQQQRLELCSICSVFSKVAAVVVERQRKWNHEAYRHAGNPTTEPQRHPRRNAVAPPRQRREQHERRARRQEVQPKQRALDLGLELRNHRRIGSAVTGDADDEWDEPIRIAGMRRGAQIGGVGHGSHYGCCGRSATSATRAPARDLCMRSKENQLERIVDHGDECTVVRVNDVTPQRPAMEVGEHPSVMGTNLDAMPTDPDAIGRSKFGTLRLPSRPYRLRSAETTSE